MTLRVALQWPKRPKILRIVYSSMSSSHAKFPIVHWELCSMNLAEEFLEPSFNIMIGTEKTCEEQLFTTVLAA